MSKPSKKSIKIQNSKLRQMKPPAFEANGSVSSRRRFVASAPFTGTIIDTALLCAMGGICTTTNGVLTSICATSKIKYIEMWSPPPAQGSSSTISLEWFGTFKKSSVITDTSINPMEPAYLKAKPPKGSSTSFWTSSVGQNLFRLTIPTGTIIDIQLTGMFADSQSLASQLVIATGTNTVVYYSYLDAQIPSHVLVPQGVNSTF